MTIGKDIIGGGGINSGSIKSSTKIKSVTVRGSIIGDGPQFGGNIFATTELGPVKIGKNVIGGNSERSRRPSGGQRDQGWSPR